MTLDPNPHINKARLEIDNLRLSLIGDQISHIAIDNLLIQIDRHLSMALAIIADEKDKSR